MPSIDRRGVPRRSRVPGACRLIPLIVFAFVCGCDFPPPVTTGLVVGRDFVPEHEVDDSYTITVNDISIPVEDSHTVPDAWYVTLQSLVDERESTYEISQSTYDRIRLNEYYRLGDAASTPDRPIEGSTADEGGWHR